MIETKVIENFGGKNFGELAPNRQIRQCFLPPKFCAIRYFVVTYMASGILTPLLVNGSCVITLHSVFVQGIRVLDSLGETRLPQSTCYPYPKCFVILAGYLPTVSSTAP